MTPMIMNELNCSPVLCFRTIDVLLPRCLSSLKAAGQPRSFPHLLNLTLLSSLFLFLPLPLPLSNTLWPEAFIMSAAAVKREASPDRGLELVYRVREQIPPSQQRYHNEQNAALLTVHPAMGNASEKPTTIPVPSRRGRPDAN